MKPVQAHKPTSPQAHKPTSPQAHKPTSPRSDIKAGFSLVELMVVVAIMGVLASVAIPSFQSYRRKAYQAEAQSSLTHIYTAEQNFHSKWGVYIGALTPAGVNLAGDLRYAVGFSGAHLHFCGKYIYMGIMTNEFLQIGPMAAQKYTGSSECNMGTAVHGSIYSSNFCNCSSSTCMFIGSLRDMYHMATPFARYYGHVDPPSCAQDMGPKAGLTENPDSKFICTQVTCDEFAIGAATNLRGDGTYEGLDLWSLTHTKNLRHLQSGL